MILQRYIILKVVCSSLFNIKDIEGQVTKVEVFPISEVHGAMIRGHSTDDIQTLEDQEWQ